MTEYEIQPGDNRAIRRHIHITMDPALLDEAPWLDAGVERPDMVILRPAIAAQDPES